MILSFALNTRTKLCRFCIPLKKHLGIIIVIVLYLTFSVLWTIIELLKFYSFNSYVYDLGVGVASLNSIARTYSLPNLLLLIPSFKPFTLFISYITLIFPNPKVFLYIQSFGTLLASIFIYLIACRKYKSPFLSVLVSFSFLFFFPVSWYLFDNFHIAGLFSTFFFAAIYFGERRPKLSFVLYFFASTTNLVLAFFLLIYLFIKQVNKFQFLLAPSFKDEIKKNLKSFIFMLAPVPTLIFAVWRLKFSGLVSFNGGATIQSHSIIQGYLSNLISLLNSGSVLFFMMCILFLVVFTTIIQRSEVIYAISIFPVVVFILFGGYMGGNFLSQYNGEYFTPILYFLILIPNTYMKKNVSGKSQSEISQKSSDVKRRGVLLFVILIIFMGIFYNPYGPGNSPHLPGMNAYANFDQTLNVSASEKIANEFVKLVPGTSSVLVDDIEPQFADRPRNFLFGPGNLPWINSTFFYNSGPKPSSTIPQYIAVEVINAELGHGWYYANFYNSTDGSMSTWFPYFHSHYRYGLLAYSYPFYLYKLNYSGNIVISSGMNFIESPYVYHESTATLYNFNGSLYNWTLLNTLYKVFLLPADYEFSFGITVSNITGNFSIEASNGVSTFTRSFNLNNYSGALNYSFKMTTLAPSDYTFSVVTSGLKGEITKYSSEYLSVSDTQPRTIT